MESGSVTAQTGRRWPPQASHLRTSILKTRASILDHGTRDDDVLNRMVFGRDNPVPTPVTSPIPGEDRGYPFNQLTHLGVRDQTTDLQLNLLGNAP